MIVNIWKRFFVLVENIFRLIKNSKLENKNSLGKLLNLIIFQSGSSSGILMDLATNEKHVHADFYNDFGDLFDDDDEIPNSSN